MSMTSSWLPPDFVHPVRLEVATGHHLRPIRETDVDIDYPAVMGSRDRLWQTFGPAWGWPPADMTHEQDRVDLARHEREVAAHQSFNYAVLTPDETELLGCVYIDPPERVGADAEISWWVVDTMVGSALDAELGRTIPQWIATVWPFRNPRFIGVEISWADWLDLDEL